MKPFLKGLWEFVAGFFGFLVLVVLVREILEWVL